MRLDLESSELALLDRAKLIAARNKLFDLEQQVPIRTVLETVEHVIRDCGIITPPDDVGKSDFALAKAELQKYALAN